MPMPVTEYRAEVQLTAAPGDRTLVNWRCQAVPDGMAAADAQAMLEGVYADMLAKLEAAAQTTA